MIEDTDQWVAIRKEAALQIDPETAEVEWKYAQTLDPYGIDPDLPEECWQVGREYFARSPGSDVWVWFGDLPDAIHDALWEKHKSRLAFPAKLPGFGGPRDEGTYSRPTETGPNNEENDLMTTEIPAPPQAPEVLTLDELALKRFERLVELLAMTGQERFKEWGEQIGERVENLIELFPDDLADKWIDDLEDRGVDIGEDKTALALAFWDALRIALRTLATRGHDRVVTVDGKTWEPE